MYLNKVNNPIFTIMLTIKFKILTLLFKSLVIKFFDIKKSIEALKSRGIINHGWLKP